MAARPREPTACKTGQVSVLKSNSRLTSRTAAKSPDRVGKERDEVVDEDENDPGKWSWDVASIFLHRGTVASSPALYFMKHATSSMDGMCNRQVTMRLAS